MRSLNDIYESIMDDEEEIEGKTNRLQYLFDLINDLREEEVNNWAGYGKEKLRAHEVQCLVNLELADKNCKIYTMRSDKNEWISHIYRNGGTFNHYLDIYLTKSYIEIGIERGIPPKAISFTDIFDTLKKLGFAPQSTYKYRLKL